MTNESGSNSTSSNSQSLAQETYDPIEPQRDKILRLSFVTENRLLIVGIVGMLIGPFIAYWPWTEILAFDIEMGTWKQWSGTAVFLLSMAPFLFSLRLKMYSRTVRLPWLPMRGFIEAGTDGRLYWVRVIQSCPDCWGRMNLSWSKGEAAPSLICNVNPIHAHILDITSLLLVDVDYNLRLNRPGFTGG